MIDRSRGRRPGLDRPGETAPPAAGQLLRRHVAKNKVRRAAHGVPNALRKRSYCVLDGRDLDRYEQMYYSIGWGFRQAVFAFFEKFMRDAKR